MPSGLTDGDTFCCSLIFFPSAMIVLPSESGLTRPAICGRYIARLAAAHSFESESSLMPSTRTRAASQPTRSAARYTSMMARSPHFPPTYAQSAWPYRYGKKRGSVVSCLTVGNLFRITASRIHIAVRGSLRPNEKYSAMPSMSHPGRAFSRANPPPGAPSAMLYWNTCTSSWPRT